MSESLEQTPESPLPEEIVAPQKGSFLPDYGGLSFINEDVELNFLQRLQTNNELDGLKWKPEYADRTLFLENKKQTGPTEEQSKRFYELSKIQVEGGANWTPELQEEIAKLYPLMDNKRKL